MTSEKSSEENGGNLPVLTVGELSQALKRTVEDRFGWIRVRGEISGFKRHGSGHLYFSLKDSEAVLAGVCWKGVAGRLGLKPEDGMEVIATGRLTTYPGQSKYQIVIEALELAGQGALLKLLEDRKRKLAAEGLFDPARKQPLPYLPETIGVITSPTGAVIRDILHRLNDRFPRHVLLWPVAVQGERAAAQVAAAIAGFNRILPGGPVPRPDLLIVARGGGSLEDLWAFNEEIVVRAVAAGSIPLIAAVGHETDVTLIDYAADRRAPTPTAAAEMAVPVRMELLAQVHDSGGRLTTAAQRALRERRLHLDGLARGLLHPRRLTEELAQRLDERTERLTRGMAAWLDKRAATLRECAGRLIHPGKRLELAAQKLDAEGRALGSAYEKRLTAWTHRLAQVGGLLESYSYKGVLARGFALITDETGHVVGAAAEARSGAHVTVTFHDGERSAVFDGAPRSAAPKRKRDDDDGQGSLL